VFGIVAVGLTVAWWQHPHHRHTSGMRLRDSPFNNKAAVYEAADSTPEPHPYGDYDGD
jgi:hypothetical protein